MHNSWSGQYVKYMRMFVGKCQNFRLPKGKVKHINMESTTHPLSFSSLLLFPHLLINFTYLQFLIPNCPIYNLDIEICFLIWCSKLIIIEMFYEITNASTWLDMKYVSKKLLNITFWSYCKTIPIICIFPRYPHFFRIKYGKLRMRPVVHM